MPGRASSALVALHELGFEVAAPAAAVRLIQATSAATLSCGRLENASC